MSKKRKEQFKTYLETLNLGLENRLSAKVGLLSGGERQALSLLMATFTEPDILLLDEHTAALDPSRAELISKLDRKSTRLNSSHVAISYAVFCLKKKKSNNFILKDHT